MSAVVEAFLLALAPALAAVFWQIREQRKLTKQNNSINAMAALQRDGDLSRAMNKVAEIAEGRAENGAAFYAHPKAEWDEDSREKSRALMTVVDYFETVSVGILRDIYDKEIIHDIARGMFVETRQRVKPFVEEVRKKSERESFGANFERVAEEFSEWRAAR